MKFNQSLLPILFLIAVLLVSGNAFAYKKVKVYMPETPKFGLNGAEKIAVLDFKPKDFNAKESGKKIADRMIEFLLMEDRGMKEISGGLFSSGVDDVCLIKGLSTKCYSVVERSRLESVLDEQSMTDVGLVDDAQAARIGQLLGIDAMLHGEVSDSRQDRQVVEYHTINKIKVKVVCTVRELTLSANIRIVDARTGEILGVHRTSQTATDKTCSKNGQLRSYEEMAEQCAAALAWEFTNLINPWYSVNSIELEKIKVNEHKDKGKDAAEAAQDLHIDKAYAIYNELFESDPYNPKYLYNMGVLYEVAGSFEKAKEMYDGAVMLRSDETLYVRAAERIASRVNLVPFYQDLGMAIIPHDFEAAANNSSLTADKIEVRGHTGDRIPVFSEPSTSSTVVARVPGKVQFEVIEPLSGWYKIRLIGGKQGYIAAEEVKAF